ncbi:MAG TPA: hypothetical protein VF095_04435 [Bacillota bacterium]
MEVYALSGPSGTGKSTSALQFAYEKEIPAIIDDGLLIVKGKKVAGTSAKFEKNTITAVKCATFLNKDHAEEVQKAIQQHSIKRILIIGTSKKMVRLIAKRLHLGEIDHYYNIEDIRSSKEIKMAQYVRQLEGKHVIPIPHEQVSQNFFKKLIEKGKEIFTSKKRKIGETTIVHPDFHRGAIYISDQVYKKIIQHACTLNKDIKTWHSIKFHLEGLPTVQVEVSFKQPTKIKMMASIEQLQQQIIEHFHRYLNIELHAVDVIVKI